ncbi:MAG: rhomboid family intramembrane serine protease [Saprospiraceae bacterium]
MKKDIIAFIYNIRYPIILLIFLWMVEIVEVLFGLHLSVLGIYPRQWMGFPGIFTSPFIHSDWGHLASNSLPIITLTSILVLFYRKVALQSFLSILLGTGLMVWLFARPSYHVGASGMVYGLISFIFWIGIFKKNAKSIVLSLIVLTLYSGSVESMFPNVVSNISWESHLFGAIAGLGTSFVFKNVIEEDEQKYHQPAWTDAENPKEYFLPRNVFEKTKIERYYEHLEAPQNNRDSELLN